MSAWQFAIIRIAIWLVYHHLHVATYAFKTQPMVMIIKVEVGASEVGAGTDEKQGINFAWPYAPVNGMPHHPYMGPIGGDSRGSV